MSQQIKLKNLCVSQSVEVSTMQVRDYPPLEPSPIRTVDNQLSLHLAATLGRFYFSVTTCCLSNC